MLAANEAVAEKLATAGVGALYRIHETPDPERVEQFCDLVASFGYRVPLNLEEIRPEDFQLVLRQIVGKPEERLVSTLLLRTMKLARYHEENLGHFGLATKMYAHFTSPIRRYPDLVVHRALRALRHGRGAGAAARGAARDGPAPLGDGAARRRGRARADRMEEGPLHGGQARRALRRLRHRRPDLRAVRGARAGLRAGPGPRLVDDRRLLRLQRQGATSSRARTRTRSTGWATRSRSRSRRSTWSGARSTSRSSTCSSARGPGRASRCPAGAARRLGGASRPPSPNSPEVAGRPRIGVPWRIPAIRRRPCSPRPTPRRCRAFSPPAAACASRTRRSGRQRHRSALQPRRADLPLPALASRGARRRLRVDPGGRRFHRSHAGPARPARGCATDPQRPQPGLPAGREPGGAALSGRAVAAAQQRCRAAAGQPGGGGRDAALVGRNRRRGRQAGPDRWPTAGGREPVLAGWFLPRLWPRRFAAGLSLHVPARRGFLLGRVPAHAPRAVRGWRRLRRGLSSRPTTRTPTTARGCGRLGIASSTSPRRWRCISSSRARLPARRRSPCRARGRRSSPASTRSGSAVSSRPGLEAFSRRARFEAPRAASSSSTTACRAERSAPASHARARCCGPCSALAMP